MLANFFEEKRGVGSMPPANYIISTAIAFGGLVVSGYYIRQIDWVGTANWFDSLGYETVINGNVDVLGTVVSREGYIIAISIWLAGLMFLWKAFYAGEWVDRRKRKSLISSYGKNSSKSQIYWAYYSSFNWDKFRLTMLHIGITNFDSYTDAAVRAGDGRITFEHVVFSVIVLGLLSETSLGFSLKIAVERVIDLFQYLFGRKQKRRKKKNNTDPIATHRNPKITAQDIYGNDEYVPEFPDFIIGDNRAVRPKVKLSDVTNSVLSQDIYGNGKDMPELTTRTRGGKQAVRSKVKSPEVMGNSFSQVYAKGSAKEVRRRTTHSKDVHS